MIFYEYKCSVCGKVTEKPMEMMEEHPKSIKCADCKGEAFRSWGSAKVHIPGNFQAANELYTGDNASNLDFLKNRMNKGTRPSGKTKVYY